MTAVATAPARSRPGPRRIPQPGRRRHLRVVPDAPDVPSPAGRALTTLVVLLFVAFAGLVVFQALLVQSQNRLDQVNGDIATESTRAKTLGLAVADAETPSRITDAAEARLGMVFPSEVAFLEPLGTDDAAARWDGTLPAAPPEGAPVDGADESIAASAGPATGSVVTEMPGGTTVDPTTGLPAVGTDPVTGAPVVVYDPTTGLPVTGYEADGSPITLDLGAAGATATDAPAAAGSAPVDGAGR